MRKQRVTVHLNVWFQNMDVVETDEAVETIKTVFYDLHGKCEKELSLALEEIGAKDVELSMVAY